MKSKRDNRGKFSSKFAERNGEKICTKCNLKKVISSFFFQNVKDGGSHRKGLRSSICKDCKNKYRREWRKKEHVKLKEKEYRENNKDRHYELKKDWKKKNHAHYRKVENARNKVRRKTDIKFKLRTNLARRVNNALRTTLKGKYNPKKLENTITLLGCSVPGLIKHLEKKFKKNMTWENYGKWEIDHIKPCASFDLTKKEEQLKCFNYKNLQPLWKIDNIKKSDKTS